jgi:hypothetical protein
MADPIVPFLREVPEDVEELLADARTAVADAAGMHERTRAISRLGDVLRMAGDPEAALQLLADARAACRHLDDPELERRTRLRHAIAQQYVGAVDDAVIAMTDLASEIPDDDPLASFVHQHLGKALVEAGHLTAGRSHLQHALQLRADERRGLAASSRRALAALDTHVGR